MDFEGKFTKIENASARCVSRLKAPVLLRSSQNQAMRNERLKVVKVDRRQFCAAADGHGCNHAIGQAPGAASGLVEQICGEGGIGGKKRFRIRKNLQRQCPGGGVQRSAQILRPRNAADAKVFSSR